MKDILKVKRLKRVAFVTLGISIICMSYFKEASKWRVDILSTVKLSNHSLGENIKVLSNEELNSKIGVYSWDINDLFNDRLTVASLCDNLKIDEIFQEIPSNYLNDDLSNAINELQKDVKKKVEISYLCGNPSWYSDSSYGKSKIDELVKYNLNYGDENAIEKVVFDIEPWVLGISNWEDDFLKTIKEIYSYANLKKITFLLTILFWLDTSEDINDKNIYKEIIKNSHGVIIMNYNRHVYDKGIDNELYYAKKNGKIIYSAAETQAPIDIYGVYDSTTYYNVGLDKLRGDWQYLKNKYKYFNLGFVYHDLSSLKNITYNVKL